MFKDGEKERSQRLDILANFRKKFFTTPLGICTQIDLESSKFEYILLSKAAGRFGYYKVEVLDKRRREGQFESESEQAALSERYRTNCLAFCFEI